jgi:hypothetical protein
MSEESRRSSAWETRFAAARSTGPGKGDQRAGLLLWRRLDDAAAFPGGGYFTLASRRARLSRLQSRSHPDRFASTGARARAVAWGEAPRLTVPRERVMPTFVERHRPSRRDQREWLRVHGPELLPSALTSNPPTGDRHRNGPPPACRPPFVTTALLPRRRGRGTGPLPVRRLLRASSTRSLRERLAAAGCGGELSHEAGHFN